MPPLHKQGGGNAQNDALHSSSQKNYDPINWDAYFDELFYLSDVRLPPLRAPPSSGLAQKESSSSASMALATPH
jgi:hypothetical protein